MEKAVHGGFPPTRAATAPTAAAAAAGTTTATATAAAAAATATAAAATNTGMIRCHRTGIQLVATAPRQGRA